MAVLQRALTGYEEAVRADLQNHLQFKDDTAYRQVQPTRLDEIKNLHVEVQADTVNKGLTLEASSNRCPPSAGFEK